MTRATFSTLFFVKWKKQLKNGEVPVYLRINYNGTNTEISIKRSIKPEAWDAAKNKAKGNSPEAKEINDYINSIRGQLFNIQKELQESGKPVTAKALANTFQGVGEKQWTLVELFRQHNQDMEKLVGVEYAPLTLQRFNAGLKHVEIFCAEHRKDINLPLNAIDIKFIKDFEFYLKTTAKCQHNSAMKHVKALKKIIRIALANDYIKKDPFFSYKITQKQVEREVLTERELQIIIEKPIFIERLDVIRDLFLFQCFTGLAYKDLVTLESHHIQFGIDAKKWIIKEREKTGVGFRVPLFPAAERIVRKYDTHPERQRNNKLFPVPSNQKMNAYLKELADICGIIKPLHTHIARHTFATTVTLANDVPIETVSKLLGHTKIQTTQIYSKVLETKVSDDMERLRAKFA